VSNAHFLILVAVLLLGFAVYCLVSKPKP